MQLVNPHTSVQTRRSEVWQHPVDYGRVPHLQELREGGTGEPLHAYSELEQKRRLMSMSPRFRQGAGAMNAMWKMSVGHWQSCDKIKEEVCLTEGGHLK